MKLKDQSFYNPQKKQDISASEYRREYTRLYVNYNKRMQNMKKNNFSWTETYQKFKGIKKPSEIKSERGIRNSLAMLYNFFTDPLTSTTAQRAARNRIVDNFNNVGIPLKKSEYKDYMLFLEWLSDNFKGVSFSSNQIYEEWTKAKDATGRRKNAKDLYQTFISNMGLKYAHAE